MTKQQDAINKRMREAIKLQRRKQLWQKRRSPINGIGLFAALTDQSRHADHRVQRPRYPRGKKAQSCYCAAQHHVIKFDASARHGCPTAVESGRLRQSRLLSQLRHKKKRGGPVVNQVSGRLNRDEEP